MMSDAGRLLVVLGAVLAIIGMVLIYAPKIPLLGKLPGDIVWRRGNFTFYFPLATSILLSLALTFIFWIINRR